MLSVSINRELLDDALEGLRNSPPMLSCKWFYDERGSQLFDLICELPEYYPTRTELAITERAAPAIAARLGPQVALIEFGSGSSLKTRVLLRAMSLQCYVPLDISGEHLLESAAQLEREFPDLNIVPVVADYTEPFALPSLDGATRVIYFPGSTIGNFEPSEAVGFLSRAAQLGDWLLIGVDLRKNIEVLRAAYNDAAEVTAAFNLNLLERLNREAGADFDLENWCHLAAWDEEKSRIEMRLVSNAAQTVHLGGVSFHFAREDYIVTEHSHKYSLEGFQKLAARAGWDVETVWTDEKSWFSLQLARAQ